MPATPAHTPLRRRHRAITLMLIGLLAIQAVTLGVFGVMLWNDRSRAAGDSAERTINLAGQAATARVAAFTGQVESTVGLIVRAQRTGILGGVADARTARVLLLTLRSNAAFDAVYVGYPDGSFVDASRDDAYPGAAYRLKTIVGARGGVRRVVRATYLTSAFRVLVREQVHGDRYDPRARPWYRAALARGGTVWTDPYLFFTDQAAGITAARATGTDRRRVVIGIDLRLTELERFAGDLRVGDHGGAALIGPGDTVLAGGSPDAIRNARPGEMPALPDAGTLLGAPDVVRDLLAAARRSGGTSVTTFGSGARRTTVALAPVQVGGDRWVVALHAPTDDLLGPEHARARSLRGIAALGLVSMLLAIGVAVAMRRPLGDMSDAAGRDPLTGLLTRRELVHMGERHFQRARRDGDLSVLLVDVDHFKRVNDSHGHGAGDEVLRSVADGLRAASRPTDAVGRYAGDEFMVLLPGAPAHEARYIAERVVHHVRRAAERRGTTVSVGAATLGTHAAFADLVACADRALYRAKDAGRDRAVFDDGEEPSPAEPVGPGSGGDGG